MKKKIVLSLLTGATTSLMALGGEFAYLYKDPRIMGMGGVNVAVGGYSTSLFSNPAGLASIKKSDGFVVDVLSIGVDATSKIKDFAQDVNDADDNHKAEAVAKYNGQHFHVGVNNYSAVSKNSEQFAWSVGLLTAVDINLAPHSNGSSSGGILTTSSRGYGGIVLGAAKEYSTEFGRVDVGVGAKFIMQKSYEGSLLVSDLTGNQDIGTTLQNKFEKDSSGFGLDLGVNYHPFENSIFHPTFGASMLNIGSMGMDDQYGQQPLTVNLGAAIHPEVSFLSSLVVGVDYVDLFNANQVRTYSYNSNNEAIAYTDNTDSDFMKRLRLGVGAGLIDTTYFTANLNLGMYQSSYTAGLDMALTVVKLNFATYEEEVGTGSVSIPDRRYMAQIGIGW